MRYVKRKDYEEFLVNYSEKQILRLACCDCGLVHSFAFHHYKNGKLGVAAKREPRATAQLRRHRHGALQEENNYSKYIILNRATLKSGQMPEGNKEGK